MHNIVELLLEQNEPLSVMCCVILNISPMLIGVVCPSHKQIIPLQQLCLLHCSVPGSLFQLQHNVKLLNKNLHAYRQIERVHQCKMKG